MSEEDVGLLGAKIDELGKRVESLEGTVTKIVTKNAQYERIIRSLKNAGLVFLGIGVGTGCVQINSIFSFFGG